MNPIRVIQGPTHGNPLLADILRRKILHQSHSRSDFDFLVPRLDVLLSFFSVSVPMRPGSRRVVYIREQNVVS